MTASSLRRLRPGLGELPVLAWTSAMAWSGGRRPVAVATVTGHLAAVIVGWARRTLFRAPGGTALVSVSALSGVENVRLARALLAVEIIVIAASLVWLARIQASVAVGCLLAVSCIVPGLVQTWWSAARRDPDWDQAVRVARRHDPRPDVLSAAAAWPAGRGHLAGLLDDLLSSPWPRPILLHARTEALARAYARRWGFAATQPGSRALIKPSTSPGRGGPA